MKRNDLDLALIAPKLDAKFSPNLHQWLKHRPYSELQHVYKDAEGALWIGRVDDFWFSGIRLGSVLCNGKKQGTYAYPNKGKDLTKVTDFWPNYVRNGRCAIDPEHQAYFIDDASRWLTEGGVRHCQWCGNHTQVLLEWEEVKVEEKAAWVAV